MATLLKSRQAVLDFLDSGHPLPKKLAAILLYAHSIQAELDGAESSSFDADSALAEARQFAVSADFEAIPEFFRTLEILTDTWKQRLESPSPAPWSDEYRLLARYFVDRYWLQAVSDYDLVSRVKLAVISCITIRILGGDLISTAQLYSKEIENSIDNLEAILDGAYAAPAFTDQQLLGLLLL